MLAPPIVLTCRVHGSIRPPLKINLLAGIFTAYTFAVFTSKILLLVAYAFVRNFKQRFL